MTAWCQVRELGEVVSTLDGAWTSDPVSACREPQAFEVHVEHVIGLIVQLCASHEREVSLSHGYVRSVKHRPPSSIT